MRIKRVRRGMAALLAALMLGSALCAETRPVAVYAAAADTADGIRQWAAAAEDSKREHDRTMIIVMVISYGVALLFAGGGLAVGIWAWKDWRKKGH